MTFRTTIGITVFGEPVGYSADALISEFQSFVIENSQFDLVITVNKYPALTYDEICYQPYINCDNKYWPASSCLHDETKAKFATDVQVNMMLFDIINKPICFGGACECWDSINGVPLVMIPLGAWPDVDNIPGGPWTRALSQTLVHEWMHAIDYILELLGYPELPSTDTCTQYDFTGDNDPGWANCLKYFLSLITTDAYSALENWHKLSLVSPTYVFVHTNETLQFVAKDIYGNQLNTGVIWEKTSGVGSIDAIGLYSAGSITGNATISATYSGVTKTASIIVTQSTGIISINTTPVNGRILIDGEYKGDGTWTETINIGNHTVFFGIVSGYVTPHQQTVTINAGETIYVTGTYIPISITGSVRFHTSPDTAEVWTGTTLLGTTDSSGILLVPNLPVGNIDFVIKKSGYFDSPIHTITVIVGSIIDTPLIILSPKVAIAGFGDIGMIMIAGIAIGNIFNSIEENNSIITKRKYKKEKNIEKNNIIITKRKYNKKL